MMDTFKFNSAGDSDKVMKDKDVQTEQGMCIMCSYLNIVRLLF